MFGDPLNEHVDGVLHGGFGVDYDRRDANGNVEGRGFFGHDVEGEDWRGF